MPRPPQSASPADEHRPAWFEQFLADRGTRKPSAHTLKAYRQDFDAIAALLAGDTHDLVRLPLAVIDTEAMRSAFAEYARTHEAASIRRCWSTWNVLCTFLFTAELIAANPMPMIGRPKQPKSLPKSLPPESVTALLAAVSIAPQRPRSTDWLERDRALIITGLLAGRRADELLRANIGDLRRTDDGAVLQVRGKGDKDRRIPVEAVLVDILEHYLDSRKTRFPHTTRRSSPTGGLAGWPATHRCSSVATANASPAAPCNTAHCAPSGRPGSTAPAPKVPCCTAFDTPSPPNWPTPTSAFTP